jgi:16S rRNA (cytosine967-C5)-methyltransferase
VAAQVLVRVEQDAAFAAAALDAELSRAVQMSGRDRALATELAYGTLRVLPWLDARIGRHAKKGIAGMEPRARAHLQIAAYQLFFLSRVPAFAAVSEGVDAVRAASGPKVAGFANAVLRALAREAAGGPAPVEEAVVQSAAPWLREALARAIGEEEVTPFLLGDGRDRDARTPPLGIRVEREEERGAWLERLREAAPDGSFEPGRVSPLAILGRGAGKPQALPGWSEGAWSVQEEGSQLVALALGARPGETILDACAGRGNKTGVLAAAVGPNGSVDAVDVHPAKLEQLARGLQRTGRAIRAGYAVDWSVGSGDVPSGYDRILVDAPCSGIGTLRRRPDLQIRRTAEELASLTALQRAITQRAAVHLRPGGRLVFAVCSVLREEAEDVVQSLLGTSPDLEPAPFDAPSVRAALSAPDLASLRLLPHIHGTDGYFLASFVRRR